MDSFQKHLTEFLGDLENLNGVFHEIHQQKDKNFNDT